MWLRGKVATRRLRALEAVRTPARGLLRPERNPFPFSLVVASDAAIEWPRNPSLKNPLSAVEVAQYRLDLDVTYKGGDRDVLAHEFTVDGGRLIHEIVFSNEKAISVGAPMVVPRIEVLS